MFIGDSANGLVITTGLLRLVGNTIAEVRARDADHIEERRRLVLGAHEERVKT